MAQERKAFITLGKSKFSKFANGTVLVILLIYVAIKSGIIEPAVTRGFDYTIPANELSVSSAQELQEKLSGFSINEKKLSSELAKAGIDLHQFQENTSMELVISTTQNGFEGLVVEFQSTLDPNQLKSVYANIADQIQNHVSGKKD
ncbi:hypothetical protein ACJJIF_02970 [Microbulbifer sp. SSSA002]|uniref:hypothetical protein n=1 Tax=unclassified Microbulbifer TaxID=2619833 RepID=UPI00403979EB